ncbi:MAG: hypothetical protein LBU13_08680, partial [Synergistaceae bacterium]|nr:hypothetical protein [Synergistaceae bacterium]
MSKKKKNSIMRFCAAIMLLMFVLNEPLQAVAATPEIMAVLKSDIAEDDADRLSTSPKRVNVLLLLESTAAMSFSIKGVMPLVTPDQNDS